MVGGREQTHKGAPSPATCHSEDHTRSLPSTAHPPTPPPGLMQTPHLCQPSYRVVPLVGLGEEEGEETDLGLLLDSSLERRRTCPPFCR